LSRIKTFVCLIIISVVASTMTVLPLPSHVLAESNTKVVGYFVSWAVYDRDFHVVDIPAEKLTHINYAFANISDAGEIVLGDPYADIDKFYPGDSWDQGALRGNFHQLQILKAAHPHLKTLISVGGWSWSGKFSDVALTEQSRQKFAKSCVDFITQYGFDGVDIDWEYPVSGGKEPGRPEDKINYTLLLEELRNQLDVQGIADGKHYLLTIASPAAEATCNNIELDTIYQYLDWINLMAYDYNGGWSQLTNFNAPLYHHPDDPMGEKSNVNYTVGAYLASGVPADKLVMGVPFYGIGWSGVPNVNNGLFQPVGGRPKGTWEEGMFDYWDIKDNYIGNGYTRYWSSDSKVPWLYNPQSGIMISYDDPESLGIKAQYVEGNNLGGVMIWELSSDDGNDSLINGLTNNLPEWAPQPVYSVSRQAAHDSIGVTAPGTTWYLAEGSTGEDSDGVFETWVLVQNPGDQVAKVDLFYQTPTQEIQGPHITLEPHTRQTISVGDTVPYEWSVSTRVVSDHPVIAERAMYWNSY
jgi:chitinase